jgi:hypothetical protein
MHKEELHDFVPLTEYYSGDQITENEMGGAFITCGGEETCIQGFLGETGRNETT